MNMNKNRFWNFVVSFLPGAGHMYQGMRRKGLALMLCFFGIIALGSLLYIDPIYFLLPVVWCYAFFDSMNTINMTHAQRLQLDYQFGKKMSERLSGKGFGFVGRMPLGIGWALVGLGAYLALMNFVMPVLRETWFFLPWAEQLLRKLPTLLVCLGVIALGLFLVKGRQYSRLNDGEDDYVEYKGEDDHEPHK